VRKIRNGNSEKIERKAMLPASGIASSAIIRRAASRHIFPNDDSCMMAQRIAKQDVPAKRICFGGAFAIPRALYGRLAQPISRSAIVG
jgi:hypothetical protein